MPPYRNVQKCRRGCELAGGEEALPDVVYYDHDTTGIVESCSTATLCILHFAGGLPHTIVGLRTPLYRTIFYITLDCDNWVVTLALGSLNSF